MCILLRIMCSHHHYVRLLNNRQNAVARTEVRYVELALRFCLFIFICFAILQIRSCRCGQLQRTMNHKLWVTSENVSGHYDYVFSCQNPDINWTAEFRIPWAHNVEQSAIGPLPCTILASHCTLYCKLILQNTIQHRYDLFTALHRMQTRSSDENSVCPSVSLSVRRLNCEKTEQNSIQLFTSYERTFSVVFRRRMVGGGDPFYLKFWVNRPPLERNRRFLTDNRS